MCGFTQDVRATLITAMFGVLLLGTSLLTDYELSYRRLIPMPVHLLSDMIAGGLLIGSPWMFGFAHTTWVPHLVIGIVEASAAVLTGVIMAARGSLDVRHRHAGGRSHGGRLAH